MNRRGMQRWFLPLGDAGSGNFGRRPGFPLVKIKLGRSLSSETKSHTSNILMTI